MKQLETFLINPFTGLKVGLDRKKKFGESHLGNLAVQNTGGIYTQILADTLMVQTALFGTITNVELNKALQKTQTQVVDEVMEKFKRRNTRLNNFLIAAGADQLPVYQSFFPQGVTEFTEKVNKGNVEQLMERIIKVITANTALAGGKAVQDEYENFKAQYTATRGLQLTKLGEVNDGITNREHAEKAWEKQLYTNLLLIASENKGQPDRVNDFFDQSIIRDFRNEDSSAGDTTNQK